MDEQRIWDTGQIVDVGRTRIRVRMRRPADSRWDCSGCGRCALRPDGSVVLDVPVPCSQRASLRTGQNVVVELDAPSAYRAILLLFVLPIAGLVGGGILGMQMGASDSQSVIPSHVLSMLFAMVGGGVLLAVGIGIERWRRARHPWAHLLSVDGNNIA